MNKKLYKFRPNVDLGSLDAENDIFLINAFVERDDFKQLQDINNPKCIILGRTGSGKSALIKWLERNEENVIRIEPESLSLRHLSNSTIITYFKALDIHLNLFLKVLWKHVFLVELINAHFKSNSQQRKGIIDYLKEKYFTDPNKQEALDYLEKYGNNFWKDTEARIQEIESGVEEKFFPLRVSRRGL